MTSNEIERFMVAMHGAWPGTEIDEATVLVWTNRLRAIDYPVGLDALQVLVDERHFFPSVADLNGALTRMFAAARRQEEIESPRRALEAPTSIISPREGVKTALEQYRAECHRQNREPNEALVTSWLNSVGLSR